MIKINVIIHKVSIFEANLELQYLPEDIRVVRVEHNVHGGLRYISESHFKFPTIPPVVGSVSLLVVAEWISSDFSSCARQQAAVINFPRLSTKKLTTKTINRKKIS